MSRSTAASLSHLALILAALTAGCSAGGAPLPAPSLTSVPSQTAINSPAPSPSPAPQGEQSLPGNHEEKTHYAIQAALDYDQHHLVVEEQISLLNPAGEPLGSIDLVVPPLEGPDVFSIQSLETPGMPLLGYTTEGIKLRLSFGGAGWEPAAALEIKLSYTLDLPRLDSNAGIGPSAFGYTPLQTNLLDWYAMVPPFQEGEGWIIHQPYAFGEYLVYPAADFEIQLTLSRGDLVVAASGGESMAAASQTYSLESARNFVFSISPFFTVLEGELGGIKVRSYFLPGNEVPGKAALQTTLDALGLYQELFGPYQGTSLSLVQADFSFSLEYEGLYFLSQRFFQTYPGTPESYLVMIAAHETAHQWWYGQIASDQALEPWLDEAFCTFSELAFYEHLYPGSTAWWWSTRVDLYQPQGRIDRSIYDFSAYRDPYLAYRNATYLQGAKFLAQLKSVMGEDPFYAFLKGYGDRYRDQIASGDDFFAYLSGYLEFQDQDWIREFFPDRLFQ